MAAAVALKAVLPYDAPPSVQSVIDAADPSVVAITRVPEADSDGFMHAIADADVLLHVLAPVTPQIMRAAPRLRLVQKIGIGVDAIDLNHARQHGIAVCNMPGTNTAAVAELALALMFACLRRLPQVAADVHNGRGWPPRSGLLNGLGEIGGRTIGLVGYGAVARRLAGVLTALGARVIAHDPNLQSADIMLCDLDTLLAQSDIVSLHVPLTPQTRNLVDAGRLGRMKRSAILINTARGALVDEAALAAALRSGQISSAGLDVAAQEPPAPDHQLRLLDNVVMTPHLAWLTDETWRRSMAVIVENCRRLRAGEDLLHGVA
jgi:phosphoglycerate dehydrogenase-like enzyme